MPNGGTLNQVPGNLVRQRSRDTPSPTKPIRSRLQLKVLSLELGIAELDKSVGSAG